QAQLEEALKLQPVTGQRVGEALLSLGYVTRDQLKGALLESLGLSDETAMGRPKLGELLIGLKYVSAEQVDLAVEQQRIDGEILVEQGACTFKQIYEALSLQIRGSDSKLPSRSSGKRRVLVVDDSPLARAFVQNGLEEKGYEVICFEDPFVALEQVPLMKPA